MRPEIVDFGPCQRRRAHDGPVESPCSGCRDRLDVDLKITLRNGACLSMRKCRVCHVLHWEHRGQPIARDAVMAVMADDRGARLA